MGCNTYSTLQVVLKSKEAIELWASVIFKDMLISCLSLSNLSVSDDLPLAALFSV